MFDNQQFSTWILQTTSIQAPVFRKKIRLADKSDNHVIYHASLAKFCNSCSMVWARMQSQWIGKNYCLSFPEEAEESYPQNVISDVTYYPCILQ